jgi:hypothetical protein
MEIIFGDTFVTTPFILAIYKWGLGQPDKICVCRHLSKVYEDGFLVNDFINSDDFSTVWTTAADAAKIVRPSSCLHLPSLVYLAAIAAWSSLTLHHLLAVFDNLLCVQLFLPFPAVELPFAKQVPLLIHPYSSQPWVTILLLLLSCDTVFRIRHHLYLIL